MIWDLAQGMIAASQGFFSLQTVVVIIKEIDRILEQIYLQKITKNFKLLWTECDKNLI